MDVPADTVQEVQIVRYFDESHATLNQSTAEQAPLAKLIAIPLAEVGRLPLKIKAAEKLRAGKPGGGPGHRDVASNPSIVSGSLQE